MVEDRKFSTSEEEKAKEASKAVEPSQEDKAEEESSKPVEPNEETLQTMDERLRALRSMATTPQEKQPPKPQIIEEPADEATLEAIAERLRFFFSDANVRQDDYMRNFLLRKNGVPVKALLRFNTIKKLTTSPAAIVQAVKMLCSDTLIVMDRYDYAIGRREPFTMAKINDNIPLSLYVYNLPHDTTYKVTVDDIKNLFDSEIARVTFRYHRGDPLTTPSTTSGNPLGAAMVEFQNIEDLQKAAAEFVTMKKEEPVEPKRTLKLGGTVLQVTTLRDHIDSITRQKRNLSIEEWNKMQKQ